MKRVIMIAGIVCLAFFIIACGGGSPTSAARQFVSAIEKGDTKAMEKVATAETAQMMALFAEKAQGALAENGKIVSTSESIDGDTARVTLTFANGEDMELDLIKENGNWKVTFDK